MASQPDLTLEEAAGEADVPLAPWDEVRAEFLETEEQGQHVVLLGRTGLGKSTLVFNLADGLHEERGAECCGFIAKPDDDTAAHSGWVRIQRWPPTYRQRAHGRILLWPAYTKASTYATDVAPIFRDAIDEIMEEKNWVLYLDEAAYMVQSMKLRTSIDELFNQARSNGVTLFAGSQRPVWVSRSQLSQHEWVACFKIGDQDDATRAAEVMGERDRFRDIIPRLERHQVLLINSITRGAVVTMVDA